jgi:glycosyltransferase involved in cell wall biosynthesis
MSKKSHKIIFFSHESKLYGAPRSMLILAHALSADYDVEIITYGQGDLLFAAEEVGIPIMVVDDPLFKWIPDGNQALRLIRALARRFFGLTQFIRTLWILRRKDPDLVYVNTIANSKPVRMANILGKKVVVHVREGSNYIFPEARGRQRNSDYIFKNASNFICVSNAVKKLVQERLDGRPGKLEVIHNGIDCRDFISNGEVDNSLKRFGNKNVIGFLGNLIPRKGVDIFLSAAKQISLKRDDAVFVVVGGDSDVFLQYARATGVEELIQKTIFHVPFMRSPQSALGAFDVFCMTSLEEPFARVNLEAACMQKAIIATNVDGNPEFIIDSVTGLLIPPADASALAHAVEELLDDASKRAQLGQNAFKKVQSEFTVEKYVADVRFHIQSVLEN